MAGLTPRRDHALMTTPQPPAAESPPSADREARWIDIAAAVLLPLATVASAWCAYQASVWNGLQTFHLSAANADNRRAVEQLILANEHQIFDVSVLIEYIEARAAGQEQIAAFLMRRFREDTRPAIERWLKTDPLNNPKAPASPFVLPEYQPREETRLHQYQQRATQKLTAARQANKTGDNYVFLTVLFASVLFFGGLATKVDVRFMRLTMLIVAATLFIICLGLLVALPTASG
jgi:hypothetical protein